jgi:2-polyprenyl-3-methyl-5-hydroxy-6-metoxy-1,4-benzoquinol methylase
LKDFLRQILTDPFTGETLTEDNGKLLGQSNSYPIVDNVPVILQPQRAGEFNYQEHYDVDGKYYDYFKEEASRTAKNEIKRLQQVIIHKVPANAETILDVGCGNAWLAKHFTQRGKNVISMDISTANPVKALKQSPNENHAAIVADAYHLPFKNNSIDCIIASEVMEHVVDPKLFIKKLLEALKPGGKLIITTPYNEKIEYYICIHCNKPTPKNAHLHSFNKNNVPQLLEGTSVRWKMETFTNKYMLRLRLYDIAAFLPFALWRLKDRVINAIIGHPTRLLLEITK